MDVVFGGEISTKCDSLGLICRRDIGVQNCILVFYSILPSIKTEVERSTELPNLLNISRFLALCQESRTSRCISVKCEHIHIWLFYFLFLYVEIALNPFGVVVLNPVLIELLYCIRLF